MFDAELQPLLDALREKRAPLPLEGMAAVSQALRLRSAGMTYGGISKTMAVYHGASRSPRAWQSMLRKHGAEPVYHNGRFAPPKFDRGSNGWPACERRVASPIVAPAAVVPGHHRQAAGVQSSEVQS